MIDAPEEQRNERRFSRGRHQTVFRTANGGRLQGVYFVKCESFIKIGIATNVCRRVEFMAGTNPFPLVPLGWIHTADADEAYALERTWHQRFAGLRHRGEWFRVSAELAEAIASAVQPWPTVWRDGTIEL